MSRAWNSLQSLTNLLLNVVPANGPTVLRSPVLGEYVPLPRLSTSAHSTPSGSALTSPTDEEKRGHPGTYTHVTAVPLHHRRSALVAIWIYLSPVLVVLLALYAYRYTTPPGSDRIVNPYACHPKPSLNALNQVCQVGREAQFENLESYDVTQDRHLTQSQCDSVFPGLFQEIERSKAYWQARGGISEQDLDAAQERGQARAMIINNKLWVKWYGGWNQGTRTKAALASINEALTISNEPVPDIEFVLQTGDNGQAQGAPWALGRKVNHEQDAITLMPDYSFFSWPEPRVNSFQEVSDNCRAYETKLRWKDKVNQLFWRGAFLADIRRELAEISSKFKWGAVEDLNWGNRDEVYKKLLTPEEHCQYKFLAHAEGVAYSGRLKYLMQCRSVIIAHEMMYTQHFHPLINDNSSSPYQNLVTSPGHNFDELPSVMDSLLKDDERAQTIANNSYEHWRYWLSPASIDCYWRRLFQTWAELQTFKPVLTKDMTSFNSFILMGRTDWEPF
ncbi:uncharacterized protein JCM15063_003249 [Sporobolomyces koalae]|uniref:uncharacterized protein n=1 Tax=Sporobolomyces koalae TaxID=500713 RepID=UPI003180005E